LYCLSQATPDQIARKSELHPGTEPVPDDHVDVRVICVPVDHCSPFDRPGNFFLDALDDFLSRPLIKYALTVLPEVPEPMLRSARSRATQIYEQVNLTAAKEFQRRRESGAYRASELGLADGTELANEAGKE
jgi:hypothetical protein